jgi:hypothetical protein
MPDPRYFLALLVCAMVVPSASAQYQTHFGRNKVQYENFDWHTIETEHFEIFYYPEMEELARHGAHFAEEIYLELEQRFNFTPGHRIPLIFYAAHHHFKQTNVTPGFIPDGVGGFFEFMKGRVVVPANGNLHRFRRVIRHELVHVFTFSYANQVLRDHRTPPERFLPLWFTEGIAEYWSGDPDHQYEMMLRDGVMSNYLPALGMLDRIAGTYLMYKVGEAVCHFIAQTYGEEKLIRLMEQVWRDRDFRNVMAYVLLEPFPEIERRFDAWLRATYLPELEQAVPPSILAERVIQGRGFRAKPLYWESGAGSRYLIYIGNVSGYSNIYRVELDEELRPKEEPVILVRAERDDRFESLPLFDGRMSVSRDGRLAFPARSQGRDVLYVVDVLTGEVRASIRDEHVVAILSPAWHPDGTKLIVSAIDETGFTNLYEVHLGGQQMTRLTHDHHDDRDPAVHPDGRHVAFISDRGEVGAGGAYNLMMLDLETGAIEALTQLDGMILAPRWSDDGERLVFIKSDRGEDGRFTAQNVWAASLTAPLPLTASSDVTSAIAVPRELRMEPMTDLTSAAFDPVWAADGRVFFATYENGSFGLRRLRTEVGAPPLPAPRIARVGLSDSLGTWRFGAIDFGDSMEPARYQRRYRLDIAQAQMGHYALWGTAGGAALAFSDMMGDDHWFVTMYNVAESRSEFLRSLSFAVSRVNLHRRTNYAYGVHRFGGRRYDITDPDAAGSFPMLWETLFGGFAAVSYPLSTYRRIEASTSLNHSDKEVIATGYSRTALLLSGSAALVHDNALYSMNGPIEGWRANATVGYTVDLGGNNVGFYTLSLDARHYQRVTPQVTFASRGLFRWNEGREARLWVLGGSWDLRGQPFLGVRGQKMWFTSHELRFPLVNAPSYFLPPLAMFGVANLRGALFFDVARAWNDDYFTRQRHLRTGETLGALGGGLRVNLFGGFVLRYDVGYAYRDTFRERSDRMFRQFFFGWDF